MPSNISRFGRPRQAVAEACAAAARSRRGAATGAGAPRAIEKSRPTHQQGDRADRGEQDQRRRGEPLGVERAGLLAEAGGAEDELLARDQADAEARAPRSPASRSVAGLVRSPPRKKAPSAIMQPPPAPANARDQRQDLPVDARAAGRAARARGRACRRRRCRARTAPKPTRPWRRDPAADGAEAGQAGDQRRRPDGDRAEAVVAEREGQRLGGDADDLARPDADRQRRRRAEQPERAGARAQDADPARQVERDVRRPAC